MIGGKLMEVWEALELVTIFSIGFHYFVLRYLMWKYLKWSFSMLIKCAMYCTCVYTVQYSTVSMQISSYCRGVWKVSPTIGKGLMYCQRYFEHIKLKFK